MPTVASNTAVSGLNTYNMALSNTAKNIANAETVAYKSSQPYFISQISQMHGDGNSVGAFSPGGVSTVVQQQIDQQGLLTPTSNSTDVSILGNGFMVVSSTASGAPNIAYTRAGSFSKDSNGYLVNAAGFYAMGWPVDQYGNVAAGTNTSDLGSLKQINVANISGTAKATTNLTLAANLPSDMIDAPLGSQFYTNSTIYDSLGEACNLVITWTKTAVGQYDASISCAQAASITKGSTRGPAYGGATPLVILFDSQGAPLSYDGSATPPNIYITWNSAQTNAAASNIALNLGAVGSTSGITSRSGSFNVTQNINDGERFGNFNGVTVNEEGIINAFFDNGTNLPVYRLAIANFPAPNRLQEETGNVWIQTDASGPYILGFAKTLGFGSFAGNALESSTVNLASELTHLISLEHSYAANTRVIQTDSEMFKTLLQLHR